MTDSRSPARDKIPFRHDGFVALRTPLLPLDVLTQWGHDLKATSAREEEREAMLAADRALLRQRLREHLQDPLVREALFLASPSLDESLPAWLENPDSEWGQKVERTLVRYLSRMAGRATPFGLFAGHALGGLGPRAAMRLSGRSAIRRHARLDMDYICALVSHVSSTPEVRRALRYVTNSSLYPSGGQLRYMERQMRGRSRSYHLVGVEPSPYLERVLEKARVAVSLEELAAELLALDADITRDDALPYLEELVEAQVLVPTWAPPLTGPEPLPALLAGARSLPELQPVCQKLAEVDAELARINAAPPGLHPDEYRRVARTLESLPVPVELSRLFQVDSFRPAGEFVLPQQVADEVLRAATIMQRLTPRRNETHPLERFKLKLLDRYEGRSVPLVEALDEEGGVGFNSSAVPGTGTGPLLNGLRFPAPREGKGPPWTRAFTHLLGRLQQLWSTGQQELTLTDEDLRSMEAPEFSGLPDSFAVVGNLLAASAEAVDRGDFRFQLDNFHGPSGALYLGRFCHGDEALKEAVRHYLKGEEALRPDALFAEVVHLPEGRMGNVICRPALRGHDIAFLGQSGLEPSQQIPLTDLWVSVEGGRVVLRSKNLGREVIPRLTNAHNYKSAGHTIYRFLCSMQTHHRVGFSFNWGPLATAPHLPRVVYGRVVLSPALWTVREATLSTWLEAEGTERFTRVQQFRQQARLPRWICLNDSDNKLPIDLDNVLSVETLVHLVKGQPSVMVQELVPGPDELCVEGEEGRFAHEVVIPFLREPVPVPPPRRSPVQSLPRKYPPGSEWLYVKLYAGLATVDRLLRTTLGDAAQRCASSPAVDRWFFLRYLDPEPQLRLRFRGDPRRLETEVWPLLRESCASALGTGEAWRLQLDTYEREEERYGGPESMDLVEELFTADSEAALALVRAYDGDADARWRLALRSMDVFLEDLGLSLEQKSVVIDRLRVNFGHEFRVNKRFESQLGTRYRQETRALEALLKASPQDEGPWRPALGIMMRRSERVRPVARRLRQLEQEGRMALSYMELAEHLMHVLTNRMLVAEHRTQELVLYDFLDRLYRSRMARLKKQS